MHDSRSADLFDGLLSGKNPPWGMTGGSRRRRSRVQKALRRPLQVERTWGNRARSGCDAAAALRSPAQIGIAVGAVLNSKKMAKHFDVEVADGYLSWQRQIEQIVEEERLDGIYVIRTSMPAEHLDTAEAVQAYKDLSRVERAFRSMKTADLEIRPIRTGRHSTCAPMSSCACWPITSNGTCERPWRHYCSMTRGSTSPRRNEPLQSPRPNRQSS
jgi:hypothetical protein